MVFERHGGVGKQVDGGKLDEGKSQTKPVSACNMYVFKLANHFRVDSIMKLIC